MDNRNCESGQTREDIQRVRDELVRAFTDPNDVEGVDYVDKVVHFNCDDVPNYLKHLKYLKSCPSRILPITRAVA